jgi:hypothetical protein
MVIFSLGFKTDFNVFYLFPHNVRLVLSCLCFKKIFKETASFNLGR